MKRIKITHPRPDVVEQIKMSILKIATCFATSGQQQLPVQDGKKWHLDVMGNDWWAIVEDSEAGCEILIRHRYRQDMADLLMQALCKKYLHECEFSESK